jgi:hypothetical protein
MKLENRVSNLELSRKLKELGCKQESLFYYDPRNGKLRYGFDSYTDKDGKMKWFISAFTVAELGEMLPEYIEIKKIGKFLESRKYMNQWKVSYCNNSGCFPSFNADTEADARGLMLIYLLENKLI